MTPKIGLIKTGHADFAKHWEVLADPALGSPIYPHANFSFYRTISDQGGIKNFDCVALANGNPVAGIPLHLAEDAKGKVRIISGIRAVSLPYQEMPTAISFFCNFAKRRRGRVANRDIQTRCRYIHQHK